MPGLEAGEVEPEAAVLAAQIVHCHAALAQAGLAAEDGGEATGDGHGHGGVGAVAGGDLLVEGGDVARRAGAVEVVDRAAGVLVGPAADEGAAAVADPEVGLAQQLAGGERVVGAGRSADMAAGV